MSEGHPSGERLGRPRLTVDGRQFRLVVNQNLPVRAAAKALGVSPSSYLRLVRAQEAQSSEPCGACDA